MSSSSRLPRLLPATSPSLRVLTPVAAAKNLSSSRKNAVLSACEPCRRRKSKCDGSQPCFVCQRRNTECFYDTKSSYETHTQALKRKFAELEERSSVLEQLFRLLRDRPDHNAVAILDNIRQGLDPEAILRQVDLGDLCVQRSLRDRATAYEAIIRLLKILPEKDAQSVLQKIRAGVNVATIVNHIKTGDILLQMAVSPETRFRYAFPYRSEMPEECVANNPYMDSLIFEASSLYSSARAVGQLRDYTSSSIADLSSEASQNHYLKPFHAAEVIDPLLFDVKISSWTSVCDDNTLMRDLLGGWLRCEYLFTAAFHKDLFLEDMTAQRAEFCSPLLVNIILGYSCACFPRFSNRAEYWNPHTLMYRFVAEAKRLWELEADEPRITTVQAGILFNVFYNLCGLDEVGQAYRIQSIKLAHEMRLFEKDFEGQSKRIRQGWAFTAWALFNWETLVGFSFMFAPLLSDPPDWYLPDPLKEAEWYGEIWLKYPSSDHLVPLYFGQVFRARSQFRVIMNKACHVAYLKGSEITLSKAYELLSQLKCWYDDLSGPLVPERIVHPGHLQLHMYYHHLVLTIFEPLLDAKSNQESAPQEIVADAKRFLHTLIRIYYLRHGYEAMDLFIVIPLMLAAFDCIDTINEQTPASKLESLRSTLILVANGLYNQRRNHFLAEALFRVVRGRMRPAEIALFRGMMNYDEDEADSKLVMAQAVRSHWPVSVVKKKEDMDSQILTNLVETYAHLNIKSPE